MKVSLQALALTASLAVLTGCAAPSTPPPAPVNAPPSTAPKPRVEPPDTCGLRAVKGLVGQPR
ncbi:MAG: peptidase inhibitor I78, partial [Phenylobacterium sp.]|nr:peptidase inhibitor I78 [Phenylobacterium sp.]